MVASYSRYRYSLNGMNQEYLLQWYAHNIEEFISNISWLE